MGKLNYQADTLSSVGEMLAKPGDFTYFESKKQLLNFSWICLNECQTKLIAIMTTLDKYKWIVIWRKIALKTEIKFICDIVNHVEAGDFCSLN